METPTQVRHALLANGYAPIPVRGKNPGYPDWQNTEPTEAGIGWWPEGFRAHKNTGVLTKYTVALDIDILDPDAADAVEHAVREWFDGNGEILVRFGNAPKRAILFQTGEPFGKILRKLKDPSGKEHRLEVLGDGQQIIVHGTNPDAQKDYRWSNGRSPMVVPRTDLPQLAEADAHKLADYLVTLLAEQHGYTGNDSSAPPVESRGPLDIEATLAALEPTGADVNDKQPRVIMAAIQRDAPHPQEVVDMVVSATMAMAAREGLDWTPEKEAAAVAKRDADAQQRLAALVKRFPSLASVLERVERIDAGIELERQQDIARDNAAAEAERQAERERVQASLRGERRDADSGPRAVTDGEYPTRREVASDRPNGHRWPDWRLKDLRRQLSGSTGADIIDGFVDWMKK
jgi:hypothetical protein